MRKILDVISDKVKSAFVECGYDEKYGFVSVSNRPDLCQYQCNGAMAAAKEYKCAPFMISDKIADILNKCDEFDKVESVKPGFINITLNSEFLSNYIDEMRKEELCGAPQEENPRTVVVDYGGANVAKPLHVGHLRSAIIGESIKRINKFMGNNVIGDVHLGDWGLQMGLIITELSIRKPELPYFDENFDGEYPKEAPFTIGELEEIYPCASGKSKEDEEYKKAAQLATLELQNGRKGYMALWKHILNVSVTDLKKNYDNLNVEFDLWKGESDAQPYIPTMVEDMIEKGIAYESQGAIVVDIAQEDDSKELPPCIIRKSDGAANYETSDLATLIEREELYSPDEYIYLADKRQELHYTQFFRVAKKAAIVKEDSVLKFIGFGTMNGKDGKPFKTRQGGVLRLEYLIKEIEDKVYERIMENRDTTEEEARSTAKIVGLAALKYGDLSNQASKDYIFDVERFISFEGNTGPYILYTMVRIKSILSKLDDADYDGSIIKSVTASEENLKLKLTGYMDTINKAYSEYAPHRICQYIYELADSFNSFYHENKVLAQENAAIKKSWISLLKLTYNVLEICIGLLGFDVPDRM